MQMFVSRRSFYLCNKCAVVYSAGTRLTDDRGCAQLFVAAPDCDSSSSIAVYCTWIVPFLSLKVIG
jgi:hypothetical protein